METPPPGLDEAQSKDLVQSGGGGLATGRPRRPRPGSEGDHLTQRRGADDDATQDIDATNGGTLASNGVPSISGESGRLRQERKSRQRHGEGGGPAPEEPESAEPEENENQLRGEDQLVDGPSQVVRP